jgi:hypothetical protein
MRMTYHYLSRLRSLGLIRTRNHWHYADVHAMHDLVFALSLLQRRDALAP